MFHNEFDLERKGLSAPAIETQPHPHVVILMASYNGGKWLDEQLQSFAAQDWDNWELIVSDDGSTDQSRELIQRFAERHKVTLLEGPGKGAAANFLHLMRNAFEIAPPDSWIAFSDQDDVWLPDRISRGVRALCGVAADQPVLFCSRTWVVDHDLTNRRLSAARPRSLGFQNALVQNVVAGNTILLNSVASKLVCNAASELETFVVHDWWIYQMVSGVGGSALHDDSPTLLYRQHAGNEIGANLGRMAEVQRLWALMRGDLRKWNHENIQALEASAHRFTAINQERFKLFRQLHQGRLLARLASAWKLQLYRQSWSGTAAVWVSAVFKRL